MELSLQFWLRDQHEGNTSQFLYQSPVTSALMSATKLVSGWPTIQRE